MKNASDLNEQKVLSLLHDSNAVITDSHIVYASDKHGSIYINKDAIYPDTEITSRLCRAIAGRFIDDSVEVVIAPAIGGVILSQGVAYHLTQFTKHRVLAVYAEKTEDGESFVIKRGYDKLIAGKNVLVVEDVLTTGGSVKKVIESVRLIGGNVIGLGVLCNRGNIKPHDVANPPKLFALTNLKLVAYDPKHCPLCAKGVPINTDVGKGRQFLMQKKACAV